MLGYLSKILLLFVFSLFIIYQYYFQYNHVENFNGYTVYVLLIALIYGIYKYLQVSNRESDLALISLPKLLGFAGLHLFILSGVFFSIQDLSFISGIILFMKILVFLILPVIFVFISISVGKKILTYIDGFENENEIFKNIICLVFGFFIILSTITIVGMIGFYNIYSIIIILVGYLMLSWKQCNQYFNYLINYNYSFLKSEGYGLRLLSTEFLFIVSTLLISVNLISIMRPFPIGWDDLGAYMNYAQLLANNGAIFNVTNMFSWEIFTGIGYVFHSPTQAFFLNNVGGIVSFIFMVAIFSDLLKSKTKKFFINIPLLLATIFIAMPMFIFEQAKDMKLDPGLFFVSISSLYIFLKLLLNEKENNFKNKILSFIGNKNTKIESKYIYYGIVGILAGFAFTIKFTSLLLISGLFALLFYSRLGFTALLGYLSIFFAVFTKFGLWKMMNVSYPYSNIEFINNFSIISGSIGGILLLYSFIKNKDKIKGFFIKFISVFSGIIISLLPWFVYNYSTSNNLSIHSFIAGDLSFLKVDFESLHSKEKLNTINNNLDIERMSASGTTTNEDFGRYFGYEEGINNYIKLPWNLSMQVNQKGEFTDITYVYLALIPLILLFLPYRNKYLQLGVIGILIIGLLLFVLGPTSKYLTGILSQYRLPGGYLLLFAGFLIPLIFFLFSVKDSTKGKLFKYTSVFTFFYTFLWTIAAYGIVWYGIVMYFCFLLIIGIGYYYLSGYDNKSSDKEKQSKLLGSIIVFTIIAIYFFASSFPHAFINLKQAGYKEYKVGDVTSIEAPYMYHKDYLRMIYELNIEHDKKTDFINTSLTNHTKKLIELLNDNENSGVKININNIDNLVLNLRSLRVNQNFTKYHNDISKSLKNIYEGVTHPSDEFKNTKSIYRIGTFLKYYISENNKRIFEDALITQFDTYIKGGNPNRTIENMKILGLNYLLVDLNAATIDKDPRRNLTKRYEGLLRTFTSDRLEFISSDSMCLRLAREGYMKGSKGIEGLSKYMALAGVNYTSYNPDGSKVTRQDKQIACYNEILTLIQEGKVNNKDYAYLLPIQNHILENKSLHGNTQEIFKFLIKAVPHGYKVLFRIKE